MTDQQVQAVVTIIDQLVVPLVGLAITYALAHWAWLKRAEAAVERQGLVGQLARTAVKAAEQAVAGPDGAARKQFAMDWIERAAAQHGIRVTPEQLGTFSGAIEAAVHTLHTADALVVRPAAPPAGATGEAPAPDATTGADHPTARLAATPQGGTQA